MISAPVPCLWFDGQAQAAAEFYLQTFPDAKIVSDSPMMVILQIADQSFQLLNGGPEFSLNPSISFFYQAASAEELDRLWAQLTTGGEVLMPVGDYPFARRYGWGADRFGVNWQLMLPHAPLKQRCFPSLMFTGAQAGQAEAALGRYTQLFPDSALGTLSRYTAGQAPDREGSLNFAEFSLAGRWFSAMDSAHPHAFGFSEAISLSFFCDTQAEIDQCWEFLTREGEEGQCGWLKDRFGVSWQVVPRVLGQLMADPERAQRVVQAFLPMKKLDIATLERT